MVEDTSRLGEIPFLTLSDRSLHLGPFTSGRGLVTFLSATIVGAIVAAASSAVLWLPFLGVGALLAFVRVEGQPLDEYALGYVRYGLRTTLGDPVGRRPRHRGLLDTADRRIHARGVPVAYLPPDELQRLFAGWRAALSALDGPVAIRVSAERFSSLPYLPADRPIGTVDREALTAYRELVRLLLSSRLHRRVELKLGAGGPEGQAATEELLGALRRLGIPADIEPGERQASRIGGSGSR